MTGRLLGRAIFSNDCALFFSALYFAYKNFTEIDVKTVSWENPTRFFQLELSL